MDDSATRTQHEPVASPSPPDVILNAVADGVMRVMLLLGVFTAFGIKSKLAVVVVGTVVVTTILPAIAFVISRFL